LKIGGWARDPTNGGSGDDILSVLGGLSVWATLVPDKGNAVKLTGSGLEVVDGTLGDATSFGYLVAPIPLPAPLALMLAGLGSLVVVRRRAQG